MTRHGLPRFWRGAGIASAFGLVLLLATCAICQAQEIDVRGGAMQTSAEYGEWAQTAPAAGFTVRPDSSSFAFAVDGNHDFLYPRVAYEPKVGPVRLSVPLVGWAVARGEADWSWPVAVYLERGGFSVGVSDPLTLSHRADDSVGILHGLLVTVGYRVTP